MRATHALVGASLALSTLSTLPALSPRTAWAQATPDSEKQRCVDAAERGQQLRTDGKAREARTALLACARDVCPAPVKHDCATWIAEIDQAQPSIVIVARDGAGRDVADVDVFLDDAPLTSRLDGRAVAVDPGPHTLRLHTAAGATAAQSILVHEGEKDRVLKFTLAPAAAAAGGADPKDDDRHPPGEPPERGGHGVAPWLVVGVGAAAVITGVLLMVVATANKSAAEDECPNGLCPAGVDPKVQAQKVDSANSIGLAGLVTIPVGVLVVAGGLTWHFLEPAAAPGYAGVRLRGSF